MPLRLRMRFGSLGNSLFILPPDSTTIRIDVIFLVSLRDFWGLEWVERIERVNRYLAAYYWRLGVG
jgi:hypothetical protein